MNMEDLYKYLGRMDRKNPPKRRQEEKEEARRDREEKEAKIAKEAAEAEARRKAIPATRVAVQETSETSAQETSQRTVSNRKRSKKNNKKSGDTPRFVPLKTRKEREKEWLKEVDKVAREVAEKRLAEYERPWCLRGGRPMTDQERKEYEARKEEVIERMTKRARAALIELSENGKRPVATAELAKDGRTLMIRKILEARRGR